MKLILASNSIRRKELLEQNKISYRCIPSNVDEVLDEKLNVYENVLNLAKMKCLDVFKDHSDSIVLAADTIVVHNGVIFGKPKDEMDAFKMLKTLSNNTHEVITGVAIASSRGLTLDYEVSKVTFRKMADNEILDYIKTKEPMDKAGSYAIQGIGSKFVLKFEGSYDNIVGLPVELVKKMLLNH